MKTTPELIDALVADARPVRRLRPAGVRALTWLLLAGAIVTLLGMSHGLRPDIQDCIKSPLFIASVTASLLTAALAGWAAFAISVPGRSRLWILLPAPSLITWIATVGYQCLTDWVSIKPDGLRFGEAAQCFSMVLLTSIPLWLAMLTMLRHVALWRSPATGIAASLAVAAVASSALSLLHNVGASAMVLIWNFGTVGILVVIGGSTWNMVSSRFIPKLVQTRR
jgi:hypothetical protein